MRVPRPFTADFTITKNGRTTATGTLSVQDKDVRQDKQAGPRLSVMILNWAAKKVWFLDPSVKSYWEQPLSESSYLLRLEALKGTTPRASAPTSRNSASRRRSWVRS